MYLFYTEYIDIWARRQIFYFIWIIKKVNFFGKYLTALTIINMMINLIHYNQLNSFNLQLCQSFNLLCRSKSREWHRFVSRIFFWQNIFSHWILISDYWNIFFKSRISLWWIPNKNFMIFCVSRASTNLNCGKTFHFN